MPIHDQGYRRYLGTRDAIGRSWRVMTRAGVMSVVSKRVFLGMMLFAWAPFVVRVVQFYFATTLAQVARGGTANDDWYLGFNLIRKFF